MRPLQLKIKGLNSFMEEQAIDFSELTEIGLFGIFGPTGSGKSTILDAITLALYGEIPRAGRDLSGVVNSHSETADIYYEFQIGSQTDQRTYFVQRCYKKDKNGSVSTHMVKLCDITDQENPVVLGERVNAVNHQVGEILGLTCNDFTRSVVLPQGNFSDFLKLSGREKRDMLERIFALQEYGSGLTKRIREHKSSIDSQLMVIEGQLNHFEGISQTAFLALQQELKDLEEKKKHLEELSKEIETHYQSSHALWKVQEEYKDYQKKHSKLQKDQGKIDRYKAQYELAQKAKNIQPYIKSYQETQIKIQEQQRALQAVQNQYEAVVKSLETIHGKWEQHKVKTEQNLPLLTNRKVRLQHAIEQNNKKKDLLAQWHTLSQQGEKIQHEVQRSKAEVTRFTHNVEKIGAQLVEKQSQREALHYSAEYRERLYQAHSIEKEYLKLQRTYGEIKEYIQESRKDYLDPRKEKEKEIQKALENLEGKIGQGEKEYATTNQNIEESKQKNMAALLAQRLVEDANCPVCGSQHHPQKAEYFGEQALVELEEYKEELEKSIEQAKKQKEKITRIYQDILREIHTREELVQAKQKEAQELKQVLDQLAKPYEQYKKELGTENIQTTMGQYHQKTQQEERLQKEIKTLQATKEKQESLLAQWKEKFHQDHTQWVTTQQIITERQRHIQDLQKEIEKICGKKSPEVELKVVDMEMSQMKELAIQMEQEYNEKNREKNEMEKDQRGLQDALKQLEDIEKSTATNLQQVLVDNDFSQVEEAIQAFKPEKEQEILKKKIEEHDRQQRLIQANIERLEKQMQGHSITQEQWEDLLAKKQRTHQELEECKALYIQRKTQADAMKTELEKLKQLQKKQKHFEHQQGLIEEINKLFQGNRFVEFISLRQLRYIATEASQELKRITRGRYALELDGDGNFIMRDDFNGGVRRSTRTLSGGETFLTSLSLALALSSHIQLKGRAPLEFFFLDEGFGTLDSSLLEVVMDSLERLHSEKLSVGLISHVEELKQRIPRRLMVSPAVSGMNGTQVKMEIG